MKRRLFVFIAALVIAATLATAASAEEGIAIVTVVMQAERPHPVNVLHNKTGQALSSHLAEKGRPMSIRFRKQFIEGGWVQLVEAYRNVEKRRVKLPEKIADGQEIVVTITAELEMRVN